MKVKFISAVEDGDRIWRGRVQLEDGSTIWTEWSPFFNDCLVDANAILRREVRAQYGNAGVVGEDVP